MEGDQSPNHENDAFVAAEWQPTLSNEEPSKATYTEADGEPGQPYTPFDVLVEETKYFYKSQREHTLMNISEEDCLSPKTPLQNNIKLSIRESM